MFEGKTLGDIEKSWVLLERAEHEREQALQEALLRLENLEQLAQKFERKVTTSILKNKTSYTIQTSLNQTSNKIR